MIRTFLAIPIPTKLQKYIADFADPIKVREDHINWVAQDNIHITIGFLGETDPNVIEEQAQGLSEVIAGYSPMRIGLTDTGIFPHANSPRVLWIGAAPYSKALFSLVDAVKDYLRGQGYELDKRRFQPHITLGRVKSISRNSQFIHEFLSAEVRELTFDVGEIKWYESTLTPTGAIYKELKSFTLNNGGQG